MGTGTRFCYRGETGTASVTTCKVPIFTSYGIFPPGTSDKQVSLARGGLRPSISPTVAKRFAPDPHVSVFLWHGTQRVLPLSISYLSAGKYAKGFMWSAFNVLFLSPHYVQAYPSLLNTESRQILYSTDFLIAIFFSVIPPRHRWLFGPRNASLRLLLVSSERLSLLHDMEIFLLTSSEVFFPYMAFLLPNFDCLIFSLVSSVCFLP